MRHDEMSLEPGTKLGRYEIRSKIAEGGMGEVHLAQDSRLGRTVALKILPAAVASDPDRMRRFVQEARLASGLNHPNVAHIYEIEEIDGHHFIVMEYIEGRTLRQHMAHRQMELSETLEIGMQVAAALSAAHETGIVHRDIKPENIMVRPDGYIKVLDFGVAKLTDRPTTADTEAPTKALVNTDPGAVLGTVGYMSPEQARGTEVDRRTDLWSLGVVLYEMLAGRPPFEAATAGDVMSAILGKEPPLLTRYVREVPEALDWIITKALTKDREDRYQTAREISGDLRRLKERLQTAAEIERSVAPDKASRQILSRTSTAGDTTANTQLAAPQTGKSPTPPTASSAEYLVGEIKSHKTGLIVAVVALAVGLVIFTVVGIIVVYKLGGRSREGSQSAKRLPSAANMKITRLTVNGKTENAAISPDGKTVVYVLREGGQRSLWIRQVATNSNVQIVPPAESSIGRETLSPDGNYVYYTARDKENVNGSLFQVAAFGGTPRKILANIGSPITFSPTGNRIAFMRNDNAGSGEDQLIVANADGTNERQLAARKGDKFFSYGGPSWSPDGKVIAAAAGTYAGGFHLLVVAVDAETGAQTDMTSRKFSDTGRVSWLADGSGILVNATEQGASHGQIWQIDYPSGEARTITRDLNDYGGTSLTADSRSLVTVQLDVTSNIWVTTPNDLSHGKQLTTGKLEGDRGLAWTADNKIVYTSIASGNLDLWIMNADGTNQKQLTTDAQEDANPKLSPDGRQIFFNSVRGGLPSIWRMDTDGSNQKQLTNQEDYVQQISPDGKWIVFDSWRTGRLTLWKMGIDGGGPVQISDMFINSVAISPDGKLLACWMTDEKQNSIKRLIILPFEGGNPIKTFDPPTTAGGQPEWTADGTALVFYDGRSGTSNLWSLPLDGGPMKQLTDLKPDSVFWFTTSPDRKFVAVARGLVTSDVILISDFR
ncbi:MAG: eukaryotic-like serine/threonine-protein kinase [Blastocatellia bacterium]|nr:eukaryotic-like serine/threonine-protein kinase [Blastocatellia bacterium]